MLLLLLLLLNLSKTHARCSVYMPPLHAHATTSIQSSRDAGNHKHM
jgi:hypothetical protein